RVRGGERGDPARDPRRALRAAAARRADPPRADAAGRGRRERRAAGRAPRRAAARDGAVARRRRPAARVVRRPAPRPPAPGRPAPPRRPPAAAARPPAAAARTPAAAAQRADADGSARPRVVAPVALGPLAPPGRLTARASGGGLDALAAVAIQEAATVIALLLL